MSTLDSTPTGLIARAALAYRQRRPQAPGIRAWFATYELASSMIRAELDIARLDRAQVAEVKAAVERQAQRSEQRRAEQATTRRPGHVQRLLRDRIEDAVTEHVLRLYRRAQGSWAGGDTRVIVSVETEPSASGRSIRAWSKNGKWRGLNAELRVAVSPGWRSGIASVEGLATAGGLLTTHAERLADDTWVAAWVEQGRGFELKVATGVILRTEDGSYVHAKTVAAARRVARARADLEGQARRARLIGERDEARRRLRTSLLAQAQDELVLRYGHVVVTLADSRSAGNCASGTRSWVERHLPGRTEATVATLVEADPDNDYLLRACVAAILRSGAAVAQAC